MSGAGIGETLGLGRAVFRDIPVLPYPSWRPAAPGAALEGGPVFPADAPPWVAMPMKGGREWVPGPAALPAGIEPAPLPGRYGFVGPAAAHFGHMLGEFAHRCWVLADEPGLVPLLVAAGRQHSIPGFFATWLRLIGVAEPVLVEGPARVGELVVAEPAHMLGQRSTAAYGEAIGRRLPARLLAPEGEAKKLAILRGHLQTGRCIGEAWIEQALAAEGYRVFRPERHSLEEQIAALAGAERIVFSEGSAVHLMDLLPPIRAAVAVLGRRGGAAIMRNSLTHKVARLSVFRPDFAIGALHPQHPRANALTFIDPMAFLGFLRDEGFITGLPAEGFLDRDDQVAADIAAYVAHWQRLSGEAAGAAFAATALASCLARRQDAGLAAMLRPPA